MKKIKAVVKVEDIIDWFEDGEEIVRVEIDKDGWNAVLKSEAAGYEDTIYKFDLEKYDFEECENAEEYRDWLNDSFRQEIEVEEYTINIQFA
ncbi:hypothetical protein [uncultured Anaerococcus sp.]|uniref:hypothetical protein n=1 Tax=uncultured Anaerococcus sp. TaxID=293428 RepID=UPI0028891701|nr:hypothetical protein [uncultured Anaerococcus sp.]